MIKRPVFDEAFMERDIQKKGGRHLLQGRREIFRFIKEHASEFPAEKMWKVLKVNSNGYYYWRKYPIGVR